MDTRTQTGELYLQLARSCCSGPGQTHRRRAFSPEPRNARAPAHRRVQQRAPARAAAATHTPRDDGSTTVRYLLGELLQRLAYTWLTHGGKR